MKVFVTGGSGFIGTNLIGYLLGANEIVNYDKAQSSIYSELTIVGDIRDCEKMSEAMKGTDAIIHLAAEHADDVSPIDLYYEVNVQGARNLVEAAEANNVKKLIFTSSVALYGLDVGIPNEDSSVQPFNDYGKSKYEAELVFRKWYEADPARSLVIVRPCVIFGESNRGNVYNLLKQIHDGKFVMVGNGQNKKSMGYVKNASMFLGKCLEMESGTHVFNFADKPDITTSKLVEIARDSLGVSTSLLKVPYAVGVMGALGFDLLSRLTGKKYPISLIRIRKFCACTQVSADKLKSIHFEPEYTIEDGLRHMIAHEFGEGRHEPS